MRNETFACKKYLIRHIIYSENQPWVYTISCYIFRYSFIFICAAMFWYLTLLIWDFLEFSTECGCEQSPRIQSIPQYLLYWFNNGSVRISFIDLYIKAPTKTSRQYFIREAHSIQRRCRWQTSAKFNIPICSTLCKMEKKRICWRIKYCKI